MGKQRVKEAHEGTRRKTWMKGCYNTYFHKRVLHWESNNWESWQHINIFWYCQINITWSRKCDIYSMFSLFTTKKQKEIQNNRIYRRKLQQIESQVSFSIFYLRGDINDLKVQSLLNITGNLKPIVTKPIIQI